MRGRVENVLPFKRSSCLRNGFQTESDDLISSGRPLASLLLFFGLINVAVERGDYKTLEPLWM